MNNDSKPGALSSTEGLGPLPKPVHYWQEDVPVRFGPLLHPLYSAQQTLEYGARERAAERERIRAALLAMHERDKHRHNYWAFAANELCGPNVRGETEPAA